MRITIPGLDAPVCKCGGKMETYLSSQNIKIKCHYCGYERNIFVADCAYALSVQELYMAGMEP